MVGGGGDGASCCVRIPQHTHLTLSSVLCRTCTYALALLLSLFAVSLPPPAFSVHDPVARARGAQSNGGCL